MKDNIYKIIKVVSISLVLLLPIILYVHKFGYVLSTNHQKWAEFGSAISGIYSPIIAFIALLILIGQFKNQANMNKYQYDQTYIQENKKELNYFVEKLEVNLDQNYDVEQTIREYLINNFAYLDESQLNEEKVKESARVFNKEHPIILDMWLAIYPLLAGLNSQKEFPYEYNFTGSLLRISSSLSMSVCIAMDKYYYCATNDLLKGAYHFNKK